MVHDLYFLLLRAAPGAYGDSQAGVKSELQLPASARARAMQDQAMSATYTTAHSNAGSLTHWAKPGEEPATSWFLVRFVSAVPQQELPPALFYIISYRLEILNKFKTK